MLAVDDESSGGDGCGAAIVVLAHQSPVARALFLDAGGARVGAGLVVVVDYTVEGLIGIGCAYHPGAFALLFYVETPEGGSGLTGESTQIVGRCVFGTVDGGVAFQLDGGVLHAHTIANGKLALAVLACAVDNEVTRIVVPVTLDVFAQIVHVPYQGACAADLAFVGVPQVEVDG